MQPQEVGAPPASATAVDQTSTAMVVVGESVGDKRKREQMAEPETSSITGDMDHGIAPTAEEVTPTTKIELALTRIVKSGAVSATPQTFSSHGSLREHLLEESKKRAEQTRQQKAQRSASCSYACHCCVRQQFHSRALCW